MTVPRRTLALALLALAGACSPDFDAPSKVKGFRLLAVQAEPPELTPADDPGPGHVPAATLRSLVASPRQLAEPGRRTVIVHVGCTPSPGDPTATACTQLTSLADPAALLAAAVTSTAEACAGQGTGRRGGITFTGVEACGLEGCEAVELPGSGFALPTPRYTLPADFTFSALPAGAAERIIGVEAVDLALAVDATPAELGTAPAATSCQQALDGFLPLFGAAWQARAHVASLKRIVVRGPGARNAPNVNPAVAGVLRQEGAGWVPLPAAPAASSTPFASGKKAGLLPDTTGDQVETYVRVDSTGAPIETKQEDRAWSWFSTSGDLDDDHTTAADERQDWKPGAGPALLWVVVRDLRGGVAWTAVAAQGQ